MNQTETSEWSGKLNLNYLTISIGEQLGWITDTT